MLSLPRLSDLMPAVPRLKRRVWAIEPAEQLDPTSTEVRHRIVLTPRLIQHPTSANVEAFGEFVGG